MFGQEAGFIGSLGDEASQIAIHRQHLEQAEPGDVAVAAVDLAAGIVDLPVLNSYVRRDCLGALECGGLRARHVARQPAARAESTNQPLGVPEGLAVGYNEIGWKATGCTTMIS